MNLLLKSPKGNLVLRETYNKSATCVPVMHKLYPGKIATFKQLSLLFTNEHSSEKLMEILRKASPIASSTMHAYTKYKTIRDFVNDKGVIYVDGYYDGETTRFGGFRLETLKMMNINLDLPGAFLMANTGYSITGVEHYDQSQAPKYTVDFSGLCPTELKQVLHITYGEFKNGEARYVDKKFGVPIGDLAELSDPAALRFNYFKPGPVIPGGPESTLFFYSQKSKSYIFNYDYEFGLNLDEDSCRLIPGVFGVITQDMQNRFKKN